MSKYLFTGVHRAEIDTDKIGFPEPFYHAIYPEKKVVLAVIRNLLTGDKSLIGYKTGIWRFLESHLIALCDSPRVRSLHDDPHAVPSGIADFLKSAVECKIMAPPPLKEDHAKRVQKTIADEDYILQVPPEWIHQTGLGSQAVLVGHGYHFEVWTSKDWRDLNKERRHSMLSSAIPDIIA